MRSTSVIILCSAALALGLSACSQGTKDKPRIGVVLRSFDEERSSALRRSLETEALDKASLSLLDGEGQSAAQALQVKALLGDKKLKALALEPVDSNAIGDVIAQAKDARVPLVLFGALPPEEAMRSWDKLFFVGSQDQDFGQAQGELLAAAWKADPAADRNKDRVLQYAIVGIEDEKGPRLEALAKALVAAGVSAEPIGAAVDASALAKLGARAEAAICVDLASTLGAIDYYGDGSKARKRPLIVGASSEAAPGSVSAALASGLLAGIAAADEEREGAAVLDLAYALARSESPTRYGLKVSDAKYVWVPCRKMARAAGK